MSDEEGYPPGEFIAEEMDARGWSSLDVARRMGGDIARDQLLVDTIIAVQRKPSMWIGEKTAEKLGRAFGVSAALFLNLDRAWHTWLALSASISATTAADDPRSPA